MAERKFRVRVMTSPARVGTYEPIYQWYEVLAETPDLAASEAVALAASKAATLVGGFGQVEVISVISAEPGKKDTPATAPKSAEEEREQGLFKVLRNNEELKWFNTFKEAYGEAMRDPDPSIWEISFNAESGEQITLISDSEEKMFYYTGD